MAPGPDDPLYWPEAEAAGGIWFNVPGESWDTWLVFGLPPEPFLFVDRESLYHPWPRAVYGPPGTIWAFTANDVFRRMLGIDQRGGRSLLNRLLRKFLRIPFTGLPYAYVIPAWQSWIGGGMKYISSTVIGKVGNDESVAHTLKWRTTTLDASQTTAQIQTFASNLRDKWQDFLSASGQAGAGNTIKAYLPTSLVYTEARAAYIEQTTPDQVKPPYLIPTQYASFNPATAAGTNGNALPYAVACVLSLNTNFRGPRFRGRLYLGPLGQNVMSSEGQFAEAVVNRLGAAFWTTVVAPMEATGYELHVVSRKYVTSARIIGVRVGEVPDTMRSRRRSRPEAYSQVGGGAIGSA